MWRWVSRRLLDDAYKCVRHIDGQLSVDGVGVVLLCRVHLNELHFAGGCLVAVVVVVLMITVVITVRAVGMRGH